MAVGVRGSIGKRLIESLGLPKETKWCEIRFAYDELISIKGEFYLENNKVESFFGFLEYYKANIKVKNSIGVDEYLEQNKIL